MNRPQITQIILPKERVVLSMSGNIVDGENSMFTEGEVFNITNLNGILRLIVINQLNILVSLQQRLIYLFIKIFGC
jgi:hypothetical protein